MLSVIRLAAALSVCALLSTTGLGAAGNATYRLHFAAVVGTHPFECGTAYGSLGSASDSVTPEYFRFYVSNVRLVDDSGREVPLALRQDGTWQQRDVAFLSFERDPGCANGSPQDHEEIVGTAPPGRYAGVRFTVGIPQALDHADATIASSPLNLSDMFWSWQSGYKFVRFDGRVRTAGGASKAFVFHLGSTGCTDGGEATTCRNPNEVPVELRGFSPATSTIVADVAALLRGSDLERGGGCMMMDGEPCDGELRALGLRGGTQTVFRVR